MMLAFSESSSVERIPEIALARFEPNPLNRLCRRQLIEILRRNPQQPVLLWIESITRPLDSTSVQRETKGWTTSSLNSNGMGIGF